MKFRLLKYQRSKASTIFFNVIENIIWPSPSIKNQKKIWVVFVG